MTSFFPLQATFDRGEMTPRMHSRADVNFWRESLRVCENWQVLIHGGLQRRTGTRFVAEVDNSANKSRLFPFIFSEAQSYVVEFSGSGGVRFIANRGIVESGGSPYRITHNYAEADLFRIAQLHFNDVSDFAHPSYYPQTLKRAGETDWTISDKLLNDGPYLPMNTTPTTLTLSGTGHITPQMTSNTSPEGTASSTEGTTAWKMFDRERTDTIILSSANEAFLQYDFPAGTTKVADAYWITSQQTSGAADQEHPTAWEFQGHDGSNWVTLHSVIGETNWAATETRYFEFPNTNAYGSYRWLFRGSQQSGTKSAEAAIHERGETQTPVDLTASSTVGINNDTGFQASDVGRTIRILANDNRWRWLRITSVTSTTVVKVQIFGHALPDVSPTVNWRLGAFSATSGYPGAVMFYKEREFWGGVAAAPVTVFGSQQGDFEYYGASDDPQETDAIEITLLSSNMSQILWLADDEDLIAGSEHQIRSVGPADIQQDFSALNVTQRRGPTTGASPLQPLSIGGVVLFEGPSGKIRELVYGGEARYVAPELSSIAEHLFRQNVQWGYSDNPEPIIYAVAPEGQLIGITYDREQRKLGFARHIFGGTVESVAVIPGTETGFDDIYLVVLRTINGQQKRYIEVMGRAFDPERDQVEDAFNLDSGATYQGAPATTITGLDHLEGEAVVALADGGVVRDLTVTSGQVTLPYAASKVHVGKAFTSRAVTLPVAGPGRDGTMFGRRVTTVSGFVDVYGAGSILVGAYSGEFDHLPENLPEQLAAFGDRQIGNRVYLHSGFVRCDIEGSWAEGEGSVVLQVEDPLPSIVRSFVFQQEGEP